MRTIPPAQAEPQLTQVANCFEEWRQTRTTRAAPIPQHLWEQAITLTSTFPITRVATRLVMYPAIADNVPRLPPSRLRGVHQPVMSPRIGFSTSCRPVDRITSTPLLPDLTILILSHSLPQLRLGPRRRAEQQHLAQRPDMIRESGRHRRRLRPPLLGRGCPVGGLGLGQRLA